MPTDEQVLVVERAVLEQAGIFQGLMFEVQRYLPQLFARAVPRFIPRSHAETNPAYKQLIPYVIVACGDQWLSYVRGKQSGEARLVGNRSVGIGGHINPVDDMPLYSHNDTDEMFNTYGEAVKREVAEEVVVDRPRTETIVAILNDDSTEVGRVHLGIVHYWTLERPEVTRRERMITQLAFLSHEKLQALRDEMETWSRHCVDHFADIARFGSRQPPQSSAALLSSAVPPPTAR